MLDAFLVSVARRRSLLNCSCGEVGLGMTKCNFKVSSYAILIFCISVKQKRKIPLIAYRLFLHFLLALTFTKGSAFDFLSLVYSFISMLSSLNTFLFLESNFVDCS